jgi:hypothetical protein
LSLVLGSHFWSLGMPTLGIYFPQGMKGEETCPAFKVNNI